MLIYRVHVSLIDIEPPIQRSIELSSQTTLKQFHRILQIAMGWDNYHLHVIEANGQRYGVPDPDFDEPGKVIEEGRVRLSEVLQAPGSRACANTVFPWCFAHWMLEFFSSLVS